MSLVTCPTCGLLFESASAPAMPFCSERCRLIDLGRWLKEEQGLPIEPAEAETLDNGEDEHGG